MSFARDENDYHTNEKVMHFFTQISFAFQVISVVFVLYLFGNSGAQPFQKQLKRIIQRERRHVKLLTPPSKRCNQTLLGSGYLLHTSTSDVSLLYKNGWFLAVYSDGNINGTSDARSPDSKQTNNLLWFRCNNICWIALNGRNIPVSSSITIQNIKRRIYDQKRSFAYANMPCLDNQPPALIEKQYR